MRTKPSRLLVGTRKGLFVVERARGWRIAQVALAGDNVSAVLADPRDGAIYAALDHGHFGAKLQRSRDGGVTWEEIPSPAYPPKPADVDDRDAVSGREVPWNVLRIWALEIGDPAGRDLWCGTIPGGLFRSPDGGESWELVRSLWDHPGRKDWFGGGADYPGIHSICVDPRDARVVTVGVSCGGVWQSADAGGAWTCRASGMWAAYMPPERREDPHIQDPHRVVQCRSHPDAFWSQHHNGVFRSTDGCASWQEIVDVPPSGFGFAVAVHPGDPETAWLAPAASDQRRIAANGQVVVTRTRDGGRSFEVLQKGLPGAHAYDIAYRHALDVDGTGQRLALGTTTGSLWLSDDQGDRWRSASEHLPPVYCLRFTAA